MWLKTYKSIVKLFDYGIMGQALIRDALLPKLMSGEIRVGS